MRTMSAWRARQLGLVVLAAASTGCASLLGSYDIAPSGLSAGEDRLRRLLVSGQAPQAFDRGQRSAPDDEMLHALYHGVLAYHAGQYAEAARALDIAAYIADERMTLSLSRAALSFVTSDLALHYEPSRTERLMIPYYAALARLHLGDTGGAAVEARRLSMLLQRFDDERTAIDPALRATLRYVAGAIFDTNGDADVAYRNAAALDSLLPPYRSATGSGAVLVVLEQGFVAHRVEQALAVMLLPEEVHAIVHGGGEDRALASALVAARILEYAAGMTAYPGNGGGARARFGTLHVPAPHDTPLPSTRTTTVCTAVQPVSGYVSDVNGDTAAAIPRRPQAVRTSTARREQECVQKTEDIEELPYLLKVAWPIYRDSHRAAPAQLLVGSDAAAFSRAADISRGVTADFDAERALLTARTIARGTAKLALTKGAERKLEEKNEVAGRLLGLLGNVTNVLTERADTRSWHLLPAAISVVRVELPPGDHELHVEVGGRRIALGPVSVRAGSLNVVPARAW
jgi:hypothetical protein